MATKILVVEDDSLLLSAYRLKLTKAGYVVKLASNGEEALHILKRFKPNVILLDLIMPQMDGFATLAHIKQHPDWQSIPVIVTTNLGQNDESKRVEALGAEAFVIKNDLSLKDLIKLIERHSR